MTRFWRQGRPAEANAALLVNFPTELSVMLDCGVVLYKVGRDFFSDWLDPVLSVL